MFDEVRNIIAALGGGAVIIAALSKFIGNIIRDYLKERERRKTERDLNIQREQFLRGRVVAKHLYHARFEIYHQIWRALNNLKQAGSDLWKNASKANLEAFASERSSVEDIIDQSKLVLLEDHAKELKGLIIAFGEFEFGKIKLWELRDRENLNYVNADIVREQIENNHECKTRYENLLERVGRSFREQLEEGIDNQIAS